MARFSCATLATGIGTTARPMVSMWAIATVAPRLRECTVTNTTNVAVDVALRTYTAKGTAGAAQTAIAWDPNNGTTPSSTVNDVHTADATAATGYVRRTLLGAFAGAAVTWVFGDSGLLIPKGTASGLGVGLAAGTVQICIVEFVWDE